MTDFFTYEAITQYLKIALDIFIVWLLLCYIIKMAKGSQRTTQIFQGVILVVFIRFIANVAGLTTVSWITNNLISWGFLAIIIVFQPEIRALLEKLGKGNTIARIATLTSNEKEKLVNELIKTTQQLSNKKIGGLISIEQTISLSDYIKTGVSMNSIVSNELLCSIFQTTTPLHDGAVILQGDKIACASAYFPPTTIALPTKYGARHRAAIGISEVTDAITIVISEESGEISITQNGHLIPMSIEKLKEFLDGIILNKEKVTNKEKDNNVVQNKVVKDSISSANSEVKEVVNRTINKDALQSNIKVDIVSTNNIKKGDNDAR